MWRKQGINNNINIRSHSSLKEDPSIILLVFYYLFLLIFETFSMPHPHGGARKKKIFRSQILRSENVMTNWLSRSPPLSKR